MSQESNSSRAPAFPADLLANIATLRETMLRVHYYEESHWLAAAVSFPNLCRSPIGQDALKRAATIAWQFGFPGVSHWINAEVLANLEPDPSGECESASSKEQVLPLPAEPEFG